MHQFLFSINKVYIFKSSSALLMASRNKAWCLCMLLNVRFSLSCLLFALFSIEVLLKLAALSITKDLLSHLTITAPSSWNAFLKLQVLNCINRCLVFASLALWRQYQLKNTPVFFSFTAEIHHSSLLL